MTVEEALEGFLRAVSPKYLGIMIDHGWLFIESFFFAVRHPYPSPGKRGDPEEVLKNMDPEEAEEARRDARRATVLGEKVGMPILGMMRYVASRFPFESVERKVTPEWMKKRGVEKFPELMKIIEDKAEVGEKWLEEQCREFVLFSTGRLAWSDEEETMVPAKYVVRS